MNTLPYESYTLESAYHLNYENMKVDLSISWLYKLGNN